MLAKLLLITLMGLVSCEKDCYWNRKCPYDLYSSKTPYESIRGDIRDQPINNCKAISLWSLHRHGNRNPGNSATQDIKIIHERIQNDILENLAIPSTNCIQDIEDLLRSTWNSTLETSTSFLTGVGYEELFAIAKRIQHRYADDLMVSSDKVYFRATNEQRTVASAAAFVHGLTDGTPFANFVTSIDEPTDRDDVIRPYEYCEVYQEEVKNGQLLDDELAAYYSSQEYLDVIEGVQSKLGIAYQLSANDVYNLYELCRFDRSWNPKLRSPWCTFFTEHDLIVLEYRDDVRHYYRNGYGSQIPARLGAMALKDLYEKFESAARDEGKNIVSYFTHNAMMEMLFCALGLYKDAERLRGSVRNPNRLWRTSEIAAFSTNFIAILYKCEESGVQAHRVQLLINEKPTSLCPEEGCTWQQFVNMFQIYQNATLDFCTNKNMESDSVPGHSNMMVGQRFLLSIMTLIPMSIAFRY